MNFTLFPFQEDAVEKLRECIDIAIKYYSVTPSKNQVVSLRAPTGSGKTVIMTALIESILMGDNNHVEAPNSIFVWLSDSPALNQQSLQKIQQQSTDIKLHQCITITDESFDQEELDDGHIYFLNTQKLSKAGNLGRHSDTRQYSIWETLKNTVQNKSDRIFVIIDEAHRGMQGSEAGKATSIMQRFIKGWKEGEKQILPPMPIVIGMSATETRFNKLVEKCPNATLHPVVVQPAWVRASGLLKDRILITYPKDTKKYTETAVLEAAADEWQDKCDHWKNYCTNQHSTVVNPIFLIQVLAGSKDSGTISETPLENVIDSIEKRLNIRFKEGEVVHTFGSSEDLEISGLKIPHYAPEDIARDQKIRVVLFKENLSTGWDCPRAETMMSYRHAEDATYIAQLLGRMIRTPLQRHIDVDDTLNEVRLYLPYFNEETVKQIIDELLASECGDIPDVEADALELTARETRTIRPRKKSPSSDTQTPDLFGAEKDHSSSANASSAKNHTSDENLQEKQNQPTATTDSQQIEEDHASSANTSSANGHTSVENQQEDRNQQATDIDNQQSSDEKQKNDDLPQGEKESQQQKTDAGPQKTPDQIIKTKPSVADPSVQPQYQRSLNLSLDREDVLGFINRQALPSYHISQSGTRDYLDSLLRLSALLTQAGIDKKISSQVRSDITQNIRAYAENLRADGLYQSMAQKVKEVQLSSQVFSSLGESLVYKQRSLFATSDDVISLQLRQANKILGNAGIPTEYQKTYCDEDEQTTAIDCILFANSEDCVVQLKQFARKKFHELNDQFRRQIIRSSELYQSEYNQIIKSGDPVSKLTFKIPEQDQAKINANKPGRLYEDHLLVNDQGFATFTLNSWEERVLQEESARNDFVCWLRNPTGGWGLCIPYEMEGKPHGFFPDFLIVRDDPNGEYIIDILEPHRANEKDNLPKAKAFAKYANENPLLGRCQIIREVKDDYSSKPVLKRLDLYQGEVQEAINCCINAEDFDRVFTKFSKILD